MPRFLLFALFVACAGLYPWTGHAAEPAAEPVSAWQVIGPFAINEINEKVVEDEGALAPAAQPELDGATWRWVNAADGLVRLDATNAIGSSQVAGAFAYTELEAENDARLILELGSDDGLAAWWNGRPVLVQDAARECVPGTDRVHVRARPGRNRLLLKLFNQAGGWSFSAALRPAPGESAAWRVLRPLNDAELLDLVARKSFDYFWNEADSETGLIPDAAPARAVKEAGIPCSVAVLGFGLTAICIGDERGWVPREAARARVLQTLRSVRDRADNERGFLYHMINLKTGKREWQSELSSIDTALFLAGALTCRNYFRDPEITALADELYARVDWSWMLNGDDTLCMAWSPEHGFDPARWGSYSEHMVLYLLGLGAPQHPLPPETWYAWKRPVYAYNGMIYVQGVPLFLHQFSHAWVDFRGQRDAIADYFKNSVLATRAHRDYCLSLREKFPGYSTNLWGLNPSLGPRGYMVWGGPPPTLEYPIDGTVVPCAAGGSLAFAPELTVPVLREMYEKHYGKAWGRYGFVDAFNPNTGWTADRYLGIDVGITLLMAENLRAGTVWDWFMRGPEIEKAMSLAGFKPYGGQLAPADLEYLRRLAADTWNCIAYFVHPASGLPYDTSRRDPHTSASNIGLYLTDLVVARELGLIAPEEALARAEKVVASIERFDTWKGFIQCWHDVETLAASTNDTWVSVLDSGNMIMGLMVAAQGFPELQDRLDKLIDDVDWPAIYNPDTQYMYGGYDMAKRRFNPDWQVNTLATDSRAASFLAIALGGLPVSTWDKLYREKVQMHEATVFKPGWQGGGLFMPYLPGIYLDDRDTVIGRAAANLAYANWRHADYLGLPAWGWSACDDPAGGYLGWGGLQDEVVTPHASALAIADFPAGALANLLTLERMGARAPWTEDGRSHPFGFRDSINLKTGLVSSNYLVLDQSMLFLSLANFLEDGIVRRWFHRDPRVPAAVAKITEMHQPEGGPNVSIFAPGMAVVVAEQKEKSAIAARAPQPPTLDGDLADWPRANGIELRYPDDAESGVPPQKERFGGTIYFIWDDEYLYLAAEVRDDKLVCESPAAEIYKDDALELFIDPETNGLIWGHARDFQIGLSPSGPAGRPQLYAWFQKVVPEGADIAARTKAEHAGDRYVIEARIPWQFLGVTEPRPDRVLGLSPALHTVNPERTQSAKLNWSYRSDVDRIHLGRLKLTGE